FVLRRPQAVLTDRSLLRSGLAMSDTTFAPTADNGYGPHNVTALGPSQVNLTLTALP
ncbi:MAG: hypothetical protein QOH96_3921, partial [Blastocatellia bacterium]|nr:hypothetical protein [Blastocatellia bacterium]